MKKLLLNVCVVFALILAGTLSGYAQGTYTMCSVTSTTDTAGTLFDSGGPFGDYQNDEDCQFLIAPSCATTITLTFSAFNVEAGFDNLRIFDGQTTNDPEVLFADGTAIPPAVTCTSGYMLVVFHSDFTVIRPGFEATWTSVIAPSVAPTANFSIATTTPPLGAAVQFNDLSTGGPTSWLWDFGDGDTARSQHPTHAFSTPGTFTVTFVAFTCNESDTMTQTVTVQDAPQIDVDPASGFTANAQCGDSVTFNIDISNIAGGDLVWSTDGSSVGQIEVLAMSYGTDQFSEFPNTIAAINQHFTNYNLTTTPTIDPGTLSGLLVGKNVLLIPEQETGSPAVWTSLGPVIRQYLNNGGSVIWLGSYSSESDCMFNTGVFTGTFGAIETGSVTVTNLTHPLMTGITGNFTAPNASYSLLINDPDKVSLANIGGKDIVAYRFHGSGKAIFLAFDFYTTNANNSRILANAIEWGGQNSLAAWVTLTPDSGVISASNTTNATVTFQTTGMPAGTYYTNIGIASNDPNTPVVIVPCTLTISGLPFIGLSQACVDLDTAMQHTAVTDTFTILNTGCDTLFINSITSTATEFTIVGTTPTFLLPGAFANILVQFQAADTGSFAANINIQNNDVDTSVCVTGLSLPAPAIQTSVNSLSEPLMSCGDVDSTTFTIDNTGGSNLTFNIGGLATWLTASPLTGTVAPGSSTTITLVYSSGTQPGGTHTSNISITSNDPLTPNKVVAFNLNQAINPCVSFTFTTNTCTGFADFTSSSINTPTTYQWDFGDGNTSQLANPTHSYAANGTYTVTLIASNSDGSDTVTQVVNAIITGPAPTTCYPVTSAYCCGIGITNFTFGAISNTTPDAIDGFKDYTCTDTATLLTNYPYTITFTTGFTYVETVKAWLDMNNDGVLDPATEEIYADSAVLTNHQGTVIIPGSTVTGQPLRLRIASDYSGNPTPAPCLDLQFGQVEDYSVFVTFFDGVSELALNTGLVAYPNPFGNSTSIEYSLKDAGKVSVEVYNMLGETMRTFVAEEMQLAGKHKYEFSADVSGIYFVKLTVDGHTAIQKIVKM